MATGVKVNTSARSGPLTPLTAPSGQYFVAGQCERGAIDKPVTLHSMADYLRLLGNRVSYGALYDDVRTFFEEGGSLCHVARVVAATGTTVGTLNLADQSPSAGLSTLKIDARDPGAWSSRLTVEVVIYAAGNGMDPDTFRLILRLDGDIVEDYNNIPDPTSAAARLAGSAYVKVTNLGSVSVAPLNNPRTLAATPLTAGSDNRAAIVTGDYVTALARFGRAMGDGAVAIPGQNAPAIYTGIIDHCKANRRLGILNAARSLDINSLRTLANQNASEFVGLFAPWLTVSDGAGGVRAITPDGYVAAKRALAHVIGPWVSPAGETGRARYVIGPDQEFTAAEGDLLDEGRVSVIRTIQGTARLYGWRSTSRDEANYASLTSQDMVNRYAVEGEARLETYVFQVVDGRGQLLSRINGEMVGMLDPVVRAGGLWPMTNDKGEQIDPGYRVDTGPEVNTPQSLARNEVRVNLSIRPSPTANLITYSIVKVGLTAAL